MNNVKTEKKEYGINKILSKGTCVEYTRSVTEAAAAFKDASIPKEWWLVRADGSAILQNKG